jgi:hypothetical protein
LSRNFYAYHGKISDMLETMFNIDFLTDYVRSCVVLATNHIVSKILIQQTFVPVTQINFFEYSKVENVIFAFNLLFRKSILFASGLRNRRL